MKTAPEFDVVIEAGSVIVTARVAGRARWRRDAPDQSGKMFEAPVELRIDLPGLLEMLGPAAVTSKSGKSVDAGGLVAARRLAPARPVAAPPTLETLAPTSEPELGQ